MSENQPTQEYKDSAAFVADLAINSDQPFEDIKDGILTGEDQRLGELRGDAAKKPTQEMVRALTDVEKVLECGGKTGVRNQFLPRVAKAIVEAAQIARAEAERARGAEYSHENTNTNENTLAKAGTRINEPIHEQTGSHVLVDKNTHGMA